MEDKFYYYSQEIDDFIISNKERGEVAIKNFMLDDFIISLANDGKIVGLEIRNFSRMLIQAGINPEVMEKLKGAKLHVVPKENFIYIAISLVIAKHARLVERVLPITHLPLAVAA